MHSNCEKDYHMAIAHNGNAFADFPLPPCSSIDRQ
jgi:hypothetical protein